MRATMPYQRRFALVIIVAVLILAPWISAAQAQEVVTLPRQAGRIVAMVALPDRDGGTNLYVLTPRQLFRTQDGGESWEAATDWPAAPAAHSAFVAMAAAHSDEAPQLWLATAGGAIVVLDPAEVTWAPYPGEAAAVYAPPTRWAPALRQALATDRPGEAFGFPVAVVGDVNGDGFADLLVGAIGNPDDEIYSRLLLYLGSAAGITGAPAWDSVHGDWPLEFPIDAILILAAAGLGDFNGDGFNDVGVTLLNVDDGRSAVLIFSGTAEGLARTPGAIIDDEIILGVRLAAAGDLNGDGFGDVAMLGFDEANQRLPIRVYMGGPEGLQSEPAWTNDEIEGYDFVAVGISAVGDLDSDGFDDLLIGLPALGDDDTRGQARLYLGSEDGLQPQPAWVEEGSASGSYLGMDVAGVGDVNGDGRPDILIGEPGLDDRTGRALLYTTSGEVTGLAGQPLSLTGSDATFGLLITAAGDVNGDGYADVLIASYDEDSERGLAWHLYLGGTGGLGAQPVYSFRQAFSNLEILGLQRVTAGDLNGDGYVDLAFSQFDLQNFPNVDAVEEAHVLYGAPGAAEVQAPPVGVVAMGPALPSADFSAAELLLSEQETLDAEDGEVLLLSPDGLSLLVAGDDGMLCVTAIDAQSKPACQDTRDKLRSLSYDFFAWSPDGRYLALHEEALRFFHDSDIWIWDLQENELRNLTDDNYSGNIITENREQLAQVDVAPAWAPDSQTLVFARSLRDEEGWLGTQLYTISVESVEPVLLADIADETPFVISSPLYWPADGSSLYYSVAYPRNTGSDGLWRLDLTTGDRTHLLPYEEERRWPVFAGVGSQTPVALVYYPAWAAQIAPPVGPSTYALLNLDSGTISDLVPEQQEDALTNHPHGATLSPDGSKVLYAYRDADGTFRAVIRDVTGETQKTLLEAGEIIGANRLRMPGAVWSTNDRIFLGARPGGALFTVETP